MFQIAGTVACTYNIFFLKYLAVFSGEVWQADATIVIFIINWETGSSIMTYGNSMHGVYEENE